MRKLYGISTIDKDVRRVIGKKLYKQCFEMNDGWIFAERSNGDIEYHLNPKAYHKLKKYMLEHRKSRLYKSWTGTRDGFNIRFEVDSYNR